MPDSGNLINGETLHGSFTLTKRTGTLITLETEEKYITKTIELTVDAQSATPAFSGGALNDKAATATFSNMTTSSTDTSGVSILARGTAGRGDVTYNGAVNGWVTKSNGDVASSSVAASTWDGTTYYATGVTLGNGKSFSVTVPNGSSGTVTFNFSVDANGNTTIT